MTRCTTGTFTVNRIAASQWQNSNDHVLYKRVHTASYPERTLPAVISLLLDSGAPTLMTIATDTASLKPKKGTCCIHFHDGVHH